jgi:hypothetical protein
MLSGDENGSVPSTDCHQISLLPALYLHSSICQGAGGFNHHFSIHLPADHFGNVRAHPSFGK